MKFLYIDAIGGASGDMLLGAFLDDLVPFEIFEKNMSQLELPNYEIDLRETQKHHIGARKFSVKSRDKTHRHLSDIEKLIQKSSLSSYVKENALTVFRKLGEQEARIHQIPIEKVHFHEVGAVDSIIDIVGTFICLDYLKPQRILSSPLPVSQGLVKAAHGTLPVPAPATIALLKDYPLVSKPIEGELVTPTGAAIITHISNGQLPENQQFKINRLGYGAGSKDFKEIPNLLRIWEGEFLGETLYETCIQIETNIDDLNPEFYPYLQQLLFDAGAMDVTIYPGIMKKGRPGNLVSILADESRLDEIRNILYNQTSTLGFRYFRVHREKIPRQITKIDSPWGKMNVKIVEWKGQQRLLPEFEECRRIAQENEEPLLNIYQQIQSFLQKNRSSNSD